MKVTVITLAFLGRFATLELILYIFVHKIGIKTENKSTLEILDKFTYTMFAGQYNFRWSQAVTPSS